MRMYRTINDEDFDAAMPETIGNLRLIYTLDDPQLPVACPPQVSQANYPADYIVLDKNGWYLANDRGDGKGVIPVGNYFPNDYWVKRNPRRRIPAVRR